MTRLMSGGFAEGTAIETELGPAAIEALRPGDAIRTLLGRGMVPVLRLARGMAGDPVRVAAGAFGPDQPRRDLVLAADHAVFADGLLVPAAALVNGATVVRMTGISAAIWCIELPAHDVVLAEKLPAESASAALRAWPDRLLSAARFADLPSDDQPSPDQPSPDQQWASAARAGRGCAPLAAHGGAIAVLHRRLRDRARTLGWRETEDAGLHLLAGRVALPSEWDGTVARAVVPPGARTLRLASRVASPRERDPANRDDRPLGVAVRRIGIDGAATALDDAALGPGWHRPEPHWRWTDGHALITLPPAAATRAVEVVTLPMLRYWSWPELVAAGRGSVRLTPPRGPARPVGLPATTDRPRIDS